MSLRHVSLLFGRHASMRTVRTGPARRRDAGRRLTGDYRPRDALCK
ncbi:hypothetical protein BURCENBC7_AP0692 [Burkholderia cenocepacia BC7]|nr:uncharacterized protein BCN122_III0817 [Burkholderia cenocepacia]EPZ84869.1 hypothetical protein BURCENK562V_C7044 [Burkholderia cenocepacia K56-2Valvano]ERI31607.1 hypothetical protein BURCENBC7_AP0692 [Burkholderia cenocepacia BC7]